MPHDPDATEQFSSSTHPAEPNSSDEKHAEPAAGGSRSAQLARRIEKLPDPFREAVRLRLLAHWPLDRIAEFLQRRPADVAAMLLSAAHILEAADDATAADEASVVGRHDETLTSDSQATDALVELLHRQDRGEEIDRDQATAQYGPEVSHYFDLATLFESTDLAAGKTLSASQLSAEPVTRRQSDTVTDFELPLTSPQTFGDYDLISQIGKGGMGVVYKARQRKLNRIVALKMILAGKLADTTDVKRFHTEAEAAARLRHPNIVAIHEIGEVDGQHFFSMDYIEGPTLRDVARENPLKPRRAALLTKSIAEAMQCAHENGIVHRDVKTANILLDAKDTPQIMDFGLAKHVTTESGVTYTGQVLGTPSYMAPEQAAGMAEKIGPVTDVYAMGAVLYELLTGRPPFRAATPWDTMRHVMQREPVAPRMLNPEVPRDLETICLKCLQKSPDQRYPSAQELADELQRFLNGESIHARPVGTLTRLWRWCKRNPKVATSLAATAATILIALIVVSVSLATTADALQKEQAARAEADRSYRQTRDVVDYWFTQLAESPLKNQPGLQELRRELFEKALAYYQDFLERHQDDPTLREEIARTHFRIGLITASIAEADRALGSLEKALAMQRKLVDESPDDLQRRYHLGNTLTETGRVLDSMKRTDEAMQRHLEARDVRQQLVQQEPKNVEYARKLANSLMNVGIIQQSKFQLAEARESIEHSQRIRKTALKAADDNRQLKRDLAKGYYNLATVAVDRQNQAYRDNDWLSAAAERATAMEALREAVSIFEALRKQDANDFNLRVELAMSYNLLADLQRTEWESAQIVADELEQESDEQTRKEAERLFQKAAGMLDEAIQLYGDARPILETVARMNPDVAAYQHTLSSLYSNLGMLQVVNNQPVRALQVYEASRQLLEELVELRPDVPDYKRDLAQVLRAIASAQAHPELKQWTEAKSNMEKAINMLRSLAEQFPDNQDYGRLLEESKSGLAELEESRKEDQTRKD